jgi:hypothetical protein
MAGMVEMNGLVVVDRRLVCPGQLGWVECVGVVGLFVMDRRLEWPR